MFVEILAKNGKHMTFGSMYRPPNSDCQEFISLLKEIISQIKSEKQKKEIILELDHNLDLLKSAMHNSTQEFLDIVRFRSASTYHQINENSSKQCYFN